MECCAKACNNGLAISKKSINWQESIASMDFASLLSTYDGAAAPTWFRGKILRRDRTKRGYYVTLFEDGAKLSVQCEAANYRDTWKPVTAKLRHLWTSIAAEETKKAE